MKKVLALIILVSLAAISCKKTVESEQKAWDVNLRRANQLMFEFPTFTNVIKVLIDAGIGVGSAIRRVHDDKLCPL